MSNKKQYGQFFTVDPKVCSLMDSLLLDPLGKVLEPSAGAGNLMLVASEREHDSLVGFELDESVPLLDDSLNVEYGDFFLLSQNLDKSFDSIIGNPPYVTWKNVTDSTKFHASQTFVNYGEKTNLYHLFLDRCIDLLAPDGQMVMIVPKEWLYTTSALPLREKFVKHGVFTHFVDLGEAKVFPDASVPAICVFRFQKFGLDVRQGESSSTMFAKWGEEWVEKSLNVVGGCYSFSSQELDYTIGDFFDVKVGLTTGADPIYNIESHPLKDEFVGEGNTIQMLTTKGVQTHFFADPSLSFDELGEASQKFVLENREKLIGRKIRPFNESNYWHWGAVRNIELMRGDTPMIYTFNRTRSDTLFFFEDTRFYNGSFVGLYAKQELDLEKVVEYLNGSEFRESCYDVGVISGNKVRFQPSTLSAIPVPDFSTFH